MFPTYYDWKGMISAYKGYGIFREDLLCEYRETAEEAKRVQKLYHTVYQDLDTVIREIEILQGKEIKI